MQPGQRVVYEGGMVSLVGKAGVYVRDINGVAGMGIVTFDHDRRQRGIALSSLRLENDIMKNIKTTVLAAVKTLLKPLDADSAKEQAVRRLGVAAELVRLGEADKKKAKTELTTLGVITGGEQTGVVFDSERYVVTATTKAASSRLDQTILVGRLAAHLPVATINRIITESTVVNKAATSFAVETK